MLYLSNSIDVQRGIFDSFNNSIYGVSSNNELDIFQRISSYNDSNGDRFYASSTKDLVKFYISEKHMEIV
jgi:hypothetical protein